MINHEEGERYLSFLLDHLGQHFLCGRSVAMGVADLAKDNHSLAIENKGGRIGCLVLRIPSQAIQVRDLVVRINHQMDCDPELYAEMTRHPRYLGALMTQEATGVPILSFLWRVKEVRCVEEQPGLHWLVLAACHHGCETVETPEAGQSKGDSCSVCGRPQGPPGTGAESPNLPSTTLERIHAVDDFVERSVSLGGALRDRVMNDPTAAFAEASQKLFGARPEELFGIHEVRLAADTESMIYCVRLADHASKRVRTTAPREAVG